MCRRGAPPSDRIDDTTLVGERHRIDAVDGARLALGGAPLRSEQFRLLLETQPSLSEAIAACAVYGADPVTLADERGVIDQTDPWTTPASHPVPDPVASGCVA